ncbi:hypothetical protein SR42_00500 [Clostridium botulinum]|uniref:hypothetical protein n=1 Tax=Clostridium botulinum TaxID=1491 RepID=UPI000597CC54|nr:hypothetical protein [Clostridium botulinum]KIL07562.1 hypothetical protein SR42_00500 [Clostridium botulinum]MBY6935450.1 hypothetical protein [Clostridium botulinum]NFL82241.1 hypothetical protein [Clostridium botulinum]NFN12612.1 hypothetical protein [Clostridium botulinum]NFO37778.1 hypothetical protein [Clostridium botulinum]
MRIVENDYIIHDNFNFFKDLPLSPDMIINSIKHCYDTLDLIDSNLTINGTLPLSKLVELANLSSIVGNLLGEGFAKNSSNIYIRNKPHTYPDLIYSDNSKGGIEIKVALESNKPKGHLAKEGYYLTYRYVLTNEDGIYIKGKDTRGNTVTIWEVKFDYLTLNDFSISNTEGDSGKTAVIKTESLNKMHLLYFNDTCVPYKHSEIKAYPGFN